MISSILPVLSLQSEIADIKLDRLIPPQQLLSTFCPIDSAETTCVATAVHTSLCILQSVLSNFSSSSKIPSKSGTRSICVGGRLVMILGAQSTYRMADL